MSEGRKRYPVCLTRSLLSRIPGSPAFQDALKGAPATTAVFSGHAWLAADERPRMALEGLGGHVAPCVAGSERDLRRAA